MTSSSDAVVAFSEIVFGMSCSVRQFDAMCDGHVVSARGGREGAQKGKFLRVALKMHQAHTNRLLHMLSASEKELMVQNKQVTELELIERANDAYIGEKSDEQGSKR
ncbi:hypothetical protein EON65_44820 [archaeon]|nr:MAG: hypothetical protein EON65_44820 [archaeon]